jgi:hypothetical protein
VAHPRLTSVQHANLTRDPDAVRTSLIEALRLINATRPDNRFPARFARRFAQCTGIAMVVMIALNPLYTPHPPASTLAAPPNATTPPNTTAPVIGSPVGTTPAPSAASTSRPAMHPGSMAPGAPPGQPAPSTGSLPPPHTNDPHRYTSFELTGQWTINYQYTRYRGSYADGTPYPDQIYGLHFIPGPICPAQWATYPCYQSQWLDSSGKPRPGSLAASVTISPNGLLFTGTSYGNPEGFPGVYVRHFQGQAANDITQQVRFSGTWTDPDGNTGNFTLVPR